MKIPSINIFSPNFCKNIISKTSVRTTEGENAGVNFVEYDPKNYLDRAQLRSTNLLWMPDNGYISTIFSFFTSAIKHKNKEYKRIHDSWHFYGIEDKYGDTLAIAHTAERKTCPHYRIGEEDVLGIEFIQIHPDEIFSSKNRLYKGLGETLVSKIVEEADKMDKDSVLLESANEDFWASSGYFKECGIRGDMPLRRLSRENFSGYIKYVESKNAGGDKEAQAS